MGDEQTQSKSWSGRSEGVLVGLLLLISAGMGLTRIGLQRMKKGKNIVEG